MVWIKCPKCQKIQAAEDSSQGAVMPCAECGMKLRVPGAGVPALTRPDPAIDSGSDISHAVRPRIANMPPTLPRDKLEVIEDSTQLAPGIPPRRPTPETVTVRIRAQGKWQAFDFVFPIVLDGRELANGSVKKGFDLTVEIAVGRHQIELGRYGNHILPFAEKGYYEIDFDFSRAWGNYSSPPRIRTATAEESSQWPGRLGMQEIRDDIPLQDAAVLAALDRLQNRQGGWGTALLILLLSLGLYVGSAKVDQMWNGIFILIPVIFFHELGHYVTMRAFGYRNLRMFFIPFFGAAVIGRHYNVAGWKKVLVALSGPLPGIIVGVPLGIAGLMLNEPTVIEVAFLMLVLNGFNLLPFLPLDGGWVVHATLFVRHPILDVGFRVCAALGLLGLALLLKAWFLGLMAIFMLIATPAAWRLARTAYRLEEEGLATQSHDANSIPQETALTILAELRQVQRTQMTPTMLAQNVASVFETLNARPPGLLVSLGLLTLHAASFIVAFAMLLVLAAMQNRAG